MNTKLGNTRGLILLHIKDFITETHNLSTWHDIIKRLPGSDIAIVISEIKPRDWYAVSCINNILERYYNVICDGNDQAINDFADYVADADLKSHFEKFKILNDPAMVIDTAHSLWNRYFDTGRMKIEVLDRENKFGKLYLYDEADEKTSPGALICKHAVTQLIKRGLIMAGAEWVEAAHSKCRYSGDNCCVMEFSWK